MIGQILLINLIVLFIFMSLAWAVGKAKNRIDTVDVGWGLSFILVAWSVVLQEPSLRSLLVAGLITIWGLRLSLHIYQRTKFRGEDARYTELTKKWKGSIWRRAYFSIFLLQGALVWLISLPVVMLSNRELADWRWAIVAGALIWVFGFIFEAVADRQLQHYLRQTKRPPVMQTGLWRNSRHPNYFGELTQWWGISVMALSASFGWVGLIGPAVLSYLIVFVSGLPPIEDRRKDNPDYQEYKKHTSALIPLPRRA